MIEEVVDPARKINLEMDCDNQGLTIDELIEMDEKEQNIKELESEYSVQLEVGMTMVNLTEDLSLIEKGLQILENTYSNEEHSFSTQQGIKNY
ncbi:hypothetical protein TNCV_3546831 [Trichonephila clavipes]|nr:hypothetical protein TNCV_3546831 [Trichonephila clavipes]